MSKKERRDGWRKERQRKGRVHVHLWQVLLLVQCTPPLHCNSDRGLAQSTQGMICVIWMMMMRSVWVNEMKEILRTIGKI